LAWRTITPGGSDPSGYGRPFSASTSSAGAHFAPGLADLDSAEIRDESESGALMWVRRAAWEAVKADNAELRRQYGARVALERRNLREVEDRYNMVIEQLRATLDELLRLEESSERPNPRENRGMIFEGG